MGDWRTMEEKGKKRDQEMRLEAGGRGTGTIGGVFWGDFVFVCDRTEVMSHSRAQLSSYSLLMPWINAYWLLPVQLLHESSKTNSGSNHHLECHLCLVTCDFVRLSYLKVIRSLVPTAFLQNYWNNFLIWEELSCNLITTIINFWEECHLFLVPVFTEQL